MSRMVCLKSELTAEHGGLKDILHGEAGGRVGSWGCGSGKACSVQRASALVLGCFLLVAGGHARADGETGNPSVRKACKAVVRVFNFGQLHFPTFKDGSAVPLAIPRHGHGSGVVISADCLVVTAKHVTEGGFSLAVKFEGSERVYPALEVYKSPKEDVAFLVVDRAQCKHYVSLSRRASLRRTDTVWAVGYPKDPDVDQAQPKPGVVQLTRRMLGGVRHIQTDAAINEGDSGGLLCDKNGRFGGIVVAKRKAAQLIGFAVPAQSVTRIRRSVEQADLKRVRARMRAKRFDAQRKLARITADYVISVRTPEQRNAQAYARYLSRALVFWATRWKAIQTLKIYQKDLDPQQRVLFIAASWNVGYALYVGGKSKQNDKLMQEGLSLLRQAMSEATALADDYQALLGEQVVKMLVVLHDRLAEKPAPHPRAADSKPSVKITYPTTKSSLPRGKPASRYRFRFLLARSVFFHVGWAISLYPLSGSVHAAPVGVRAGFRLPVFDVTTLKLGASVGAAYSYFRYAVEPAEPPAPDEKKSINLHYHHLEMPVRIHYRIIFVEAVPFHAWPMEEKAGWGFRFRCGVAWKFIEAAVGYGFAPAPAGKVKPTVLSLAFFF